MAIKAVTFDIGGTLIEPWPSVGHVYAEVAARHGADGLSPTLLNTRFKAAWRSRNSINDTRAGWEELVREVFSGLVAPARHAALFAELYERFAQADAWRIFDDVLPTLEMLVSRGIRLGAISNWDERLRTLLRRLRLDDYFEVIVVSCETGFAKPSPEIFEHAAAKLGLPPASILHVGDSLEMDVRGATSAGFRAARIRRATDDALEGDLCSLGELTARIGQRISDG